VSPTFIALFSAPLLAERVGLNRWIAIVGGFVGVLIVVRPGGASFEWALLIPVACALANAFRDLMTRRLARTETSVAILFWSTIIVTAAGATTAPFGWRPLTATDAAWFVAVGVLNTGAHFFLIEAFRLAEASIVAPVRYTSLVWAAVLGYVIWGDVPDVWVWTGAAVIIASGLYMVRSERRAPPQTDRSAVSPQRSA
jgi:drug/metabolite transporter (DMT)-like permease